MYSGLFRKYEHEPELLAHITTSKAKLEAHYYKNYTREDQPNAVQIGFGGTTQSSALSNFFGTFDTIHQARNPFARELEQFFSLQSEAIESCDPMRWWANRQGQFPRLSLMARDIFSIPGTWFHLHTNKVLTCTPTGSAVAVERVFSGCRDTISLRRASLNAETIRALVIARHGVIRARQSSRLDIE